MEVDEMPFGVQDELSKLSLKVDFSLEPASGYRHRLKDIIAEVEVAPKVPIFVPLTGDYHDGKFAVKTMTRRDNKFVGELMEAVTHGRTQLVLCCLEVEGRNVSGRRAGVVYTKLSGKLLHEGSLTYHSSLWYLIGEEAHEQALKQAHLPREFRSISGLMPECVWRRYAIVLFPVQTLVENLKLATDMPWHQSALQLFKSAFYGAEAGETGARSILRKIINGLKAPLGPELEEQVLQWTLQLEDRKLMKKAVKLVPYTNLLGNPFVSSLADILNRGDVMNDEGRLEHFQEWCAAILEKRVLNTERLYIRDIHPVIEILTTYADDEDWITEEFFPTLVKLSSTGLQLFVLKAIDAGAGSSRLLERCFDKLSNKDVDCFALAPGHLAKDCMERDEDVQHHSTKLMPLQFQTPAGLIQLTTVGQPRPRSRFVSALQRTQNMPLRYSCLIRAARANMDSRRVQHKAFILDLEETRDLLVKLQKDFELDDDMKALVQSIFRRLEASKPQKPVRPTDGKWAKPELPDCCGGNPCAVGSNMRRFLSSDDCGPLRFTESEADHVLDAVSGCNYLRVGAEEEDGKINSIVVIKTSDDYVHSVNEYNDDVAEFRRKLTSLRTDWMRDALQDRYDEAILLKNTRSKAASEENHARKLAADDRERMAALSEVTLWYRQGQATAQRKELTLELPPTSTTPMTKLLFLLSRRDVARERSRERQHQVEVSRWKCHEDTRNSHHGRKRHKAQDAWRGSVFHPLW